MTRGLNIVADWWTGASSPDSHTNSHHTQTYTKSIQRVRARGEVKTRAKAKGRAKARATEILILISLYHETKVSKGIMKSDISNI